MVSKFILVNVYRPSSHNITEAFFEDLTSLLEIISTYSSMTVLVGDFNIHVDDSHDVMVLRFLDLIDVFGLVQHVTGPTHARGHTLDLVITASNYAPMDISTDPPNIISDHGFATCQFTMALSAPTSQRRKIIRQLNSLNANVFNIAVHQSPASMDATLFDGQSTSDLWELYNNELRHLLDVITPPTIITVTERTTSPWFDGECRECRKRSRALERCYRRSRLPEDCSTWSAALEEKRALYVVKEQSYWTRKWDGCAGDSRLLWCCLNDILMHDEVLCSGHTSLTAQALSTFFHYKITKVRAATQSYLPATIIDPCWSHFNEFHHCMPKEIRHVILQSPRKSCCARSSLVTQVVNFADKHSSLSTLTCGVPQGSAVSPLQFNLYTADVVCIAQSFGVSVHCYADDFQLYVHCRADEAATAITQLLACIQAIDRWMGSNRLKMNWDKTQFIWLGSRQRLSAVDVTPLHLHDNTVIMPSTTARNLEAVFDCEMTMLYHVNSVTHSCFYHLRQLRTVWRALTHDSAKMLAHAFISSRIGYCNSLLFGVSAHVLCKMQAVLNAAARLVCGLGRFDHITPAMRDDLHWLPVRQRIEYKIALLVYKCLHGAAPFYLSNYCAAITETNRRHNLRSISCGDLLQPRTRTQAWVMILSGIIRIF